MERDNGKERKRERTKEREIKKKTAVQRINKYEQTIKHSLHPPQLVIWDLSHLLLLAKLKICLFMTKRKRVLHLLHHPVIVTNPHCFPFILSIAFDMCTYSDAETTDTYSHTDGGWSQILSRREMMSYF